jgi:drug/metabolite transporter (DMT)-like permease
VTATVLLVLASAFLHALWSAGVRIEPDKDRGVVIGVAIAGAVATLAAVVTGSRLTTDAALWSTVAGIIEALYFWTLARALTEGPLGPVYTVARGGAVLLVWPASIAVWHEPLTATGIAGSAIVLGGLVLSGAERGASRSAIAWAVACAASIAGYHLAYKAALVEDGDPAAVFALSLIVATAINAIRLGRDGRRAARVVLAARWQRLVAIGAVCSVAFLLFIQALVDGGAGLVLTLRNTSVVFATVLAATIGDRPGGRQIAGAALVAAGAIVLGLGQ